ncbi:MAG: class I SAM-dependent methyltransferase [Oscillospiraceae bacterium]|nr:class I SAM-dependent methyltransferase [Oscillospiraceae bacterium]
MNDTELAAIFENDWYNNRGANSSGRGERWDQRAEEWDLKYRREGEKELHGQRITDTAAFLRSKGLLGPESDIADIGCGPGRFAAEFARTARSVLGVDVSQRMTEYGSRYCSEQGLNNTRFMTLDFPNADIDALGLKGKFDLVFSSITPAVSGQGLDNMIAMSRAWCFNACFVSSGNELQDRVMREVFSREPKREKTSHSHWFFTLFGLLWERGYHPQSSYYDQHREIILPADRKTAERYCEYLLDEEGLEEKNIRAVLEFLKSCADGDGTVREVSDCRMGWLLWDVRDRRG